MTDAHLFLFGYLAGWAIGICTGYVLRRAE